mgnify:CR=1 FL=1
MKSIRGIGLSDVQAVYGAACAPGEAGREQHGDQDDREGLHAIDQSIGARETKIRSGSMLD